MVRYKFSKTRNKEFATVLRQRVKTYFQEEELSVKGNSQMVVKSVVVLSIYFLPFLFILFGGITEIWALCLLWMLMGLGKACIGTSVMHDALHGSYSQKKSINTLMHFSALVVGVYPKTWKLQHNVLHHTYTNIDHADDDLTPVGVLRFSPNQDHKWFFRYQHIYAIFFYAGVTIAWSITKDFVKLTKYRNIGLIKHRKEYWRHIGLIILSKIFYFSLILGLPIILLPLPVWQIVCMFLLMHVVTGITLSMIFQLAHIMPCATFLEPEDPHIDENWWVHQLNTTSNYAMNSKVIFFLFGGLNFQVEHHLFPHICHVHYPQLAKIVQQTTQEFDLPYHSEKYMGSAILLHFQMLKKLGQPA
ncbi:MAG: acyl-CoA desaturase [Bacteroidota bacterium]